MSAAPGRVALAISSLTTDHTGWPRNPRALAGRLRRAQTFLRALGIDIAFSREGRAGTGSRVIRIRTSLESTVSTVSNASGVPAMGPTLDPPSRRQYSRRQC